ncbi:DUF2691 family protein [Solibacillus sp. MA9]|uniref:DUF2691 family protein n=1 Tax=Solibacillus palustris TaxID=2908203 RepID=A0ABS9UCY3_9BACL|nr:DUF2691 family protein [Solibacillus sp. MA9]
MFEILNDIEINGLTWRIGGGESYIKENGEPLFPSLCTVNGETLHEIISNEEYYLIFVDLKAFPNKLDVKEISTYQEFVKSECQFVLLLIDSSYVTIYSKDQNIIQQLFSKGVSAGYENIEYITDENDRNKTLIAF